MNKIFLLTILIISVSTSIMGQNYIYKGTQQFESTTTWLFHMNVTYWKGNPNITVAKHNNGGYLMIAIYVPDQSIYIGGSMTIFLSNGGMIECLEKGIHDFASGQSIVLFNLTNAEIRLLKSSRITKVKFSIFEGENTKTFTAYNLNNYNKTEIEISKLF